MCKMKWIVRHVAGLLLIASCALAAVAAQRTVIVISLDGFPAYALKDSRLPVPTLRKLAAEGATAAVMHPINPTVTWPNHTAMITGVDASRHHVLFNGLLTRPGADKPVKIEPWRDKNEMVQAPTVYDLAHQAGLTTAQVDWVAIYNAPTITWQFPERPNPSGAVERELIGQGTVTDSQLDSFNQSSPPWRDQIWTEAAIDILRKHKPNLLLFHLLNLDSVQHRYGPMSVAGLDAMAFADDRVGQVIRTLKETGLLERTTLFIVSDHGFRNVKHAIHPNVLLRQNGLLQGQGATISCDAWVVPEGGTAMIYITDAQKRTSLVPRLRAMFGQVEGVAAVYGPDDFAKLGLPTPEASNQSPDLLLAAKPDFSFGGGDGGELITPVTEGGSHGYLNSDDEMQAIFIAWGAGIRRGVKLDAIRNVDLAPTIATLLGLQMKNVEGHVLKEILQ